MLPKPKGGQGRHMDGAQTCRLVCPHVRAQAPLSAKQSHNGKRSGVGTAGQALPGLPCPWAEVQEVKNSQFELDLLGYYESIRVKVGGYNLFY